MDTEQTGLIDFLIEAQALKFGDFVLKAGNRSPFFIDFGQIRRGKDLNTLGGFLARAMAKHYPQATLIFGPAYKGIPLAAITAGALWTEKKIDLGMFYDRKEAKAHGEQGAFIGQMPGPDDQIVVIDDVLSSGGTKISAMDAIQQAFGVRPVGVLVAVDRRQKGFALDEKKLPLASIVNLPQLIDYLAEKDNPHVQAMRDFYEGA